LAPRSSSRFTMSAGVVPGEALKSLGSGPLGWSGVAPRGSGGILPGTAIGAAGACPCHWRSSAITSSMSSWLSFSAKLGIGVPGRPSWIVARSIPLPADPSRSGLPMWT